VSRWKRDNAARQQQIDDINARTDANKAERENVTDTDLPDGFVTMDDVAEMRSEAEPYTEPFFLPECDMRHPEWPKVRALCTRARGHKKIAGARDGVEWDHEGMVNGETVRWNEVEVPHMERIEFRIPIGSRDLIGLSAKARLKQDDMRKRTGENMQKLRVENVHQVKGSPSSAWYEGEAVFEVWRPGRG
jgi:hypothetical protein